MFFRKKKLGRRKIEICKSSEMCVAEVSRRSERSSRGKRTFEVRFDRFDDSFGSIDNCPAYLGGPLWFFGLEAGLQDHVIVSIWSTSWGSVSVVVGNESTKKRKETKTWTGRFLIDAIDTDCGRYVRSIRHSKRFDIQNTQLLKELSRSSQDSFESESDSK